jgi:conjugal transfer pilus assembly protein TraE
MKSTSLNRKVAVLSADSQSMRISNVVLVFIVLVLIYMLSQKKETVILLPPQLDEPIKVAQNLADSGYKRLWGQSIATMAGNVTPKTIQFVADFIGDLLSSEVYHRISAELGSTVYKIQQEGRTTRFVSRKVVYEEETDKVYVAGDYYVTTDANPFHGQGKNKPAPRRKVYEFVIDIAGGRPVVNHFDTYLGEIRDAAYIARQQRVAEKKGTKK